LFGKNIVDIEWDKDVTVDEELETKLAEAIDKMNAGLWEDIVKFLNQHPRISTLTVRLDLRDYKKTDVGAMFWMLDLDKTTIGCDFEWEKDEPIGFAVFLSNPMKANDSK
jgi:hypothetical protein